jgi:hypothetical protein
LAGTIQSNGPKNLASGMFGGWTFFHGCGSQS